MEGSRFDALVQSCLGSRRSLLGGALATLTGLLEVTGADAKKKRHNGNGPTCGKAGDEPVSGKCCAGSVLVDGICQRCDVCASGCAFATVQAAIEAAAPGATIAICPGTYREDLAINSDSIVTLVGAGDGEGAGDTIIQGTGEHSVVTIDEGIVTLERLRLTGGGGNPDDSFAGGGIYNEGTTKLIGCTVSGNAAKYGGGILHRAGALTLIDCVISGNEAGTDGGGAYILSPSATLVMVGCTVSGNVAVELGGGIYNQGTLRLTASEISGNEAKFGGGVFNYATGRITLDAKSRATGNTAGNTGGGIYNDNGTVTLASSANVGGNTPNNCAGAAVANCNG